MNKIHTDRHGVTVLVLNPLFLLLLMLLLPFFFFFLGSITASGSASRHSDTDCSSPPETDLFSGIFVSIYQSTNGTVLHFLQSLVVKKVDRFTGAYIKAK